jgi:hypothetical protein
VIRSELQSPAANGLQSIALGLEALILLASKLVMRSMFCCFGHFFTRVCPQGKQSLPTSRASGTRLRGNGKTSPNSPVSVSDQRIHDSYENLALGSQRPTHEHLA